MQLGKYFQNAFFSNFLNVKFVVRPKDWRWVKFEIKIKLTRVGN